MAPQPNIVSPFLRSGPNKRGMMLGMIVCLTVTAACFALSYDPGFALRYGLYLLMGAGLDIMYSLLRDGRPAIPRASVFVTTALLVLSVPAHMPWWQIGTGILVALWFAKRMADQRALRLNPMLIGRLFMMIVFADSIQRWVVPGAEIDALSSATPLGLFAAEGAIYSPLSLLLGDIRGDWHGVYAILPGSPGEVLPLLSLACGVVLYLFGILDWRPGVMFVAGFVPACALLGMPPGFHVVAGSVVFTAVYVVSDPRSMPGSRFGRLTAGLLAGVLNAAIRKHGFFPEGVVLAVLAVNLLGPTLDRIAFWMRGLELRRRKGGS